jgi:hypothetical protein
VVIDGLIQEFKDAALLLGAGGGGGGLTISPEEGLEEFEESFDRRAT